MKTPPRILVLIILVMSVAGCAAQKGGNNTGKSTAEEMLYTQALKALEERNFIIKIDEFHFPSDKVPVNSTNSYVSMQGSHAVIRMSQDCPSRFLSYQNTESDNAEITKGSVKKNGDIQFHMLIKGAEKWQDRELIIILYKNTNQCFVNINRGHSGQNIVNFKGYVYPLATE
ncbi:MAG: DUF4251 domain-containing protein [Alistipes sp.]|uniref:DUF4251 domain-containing protein n=1 Tax=Alistipes sp. TaxID=1872444 RepID=UPI0025B82506|nr:DUF4251 domain-containing protein [Alistipes sp.]MCD8275337.1 DUF4251 domain-containing protein [Alistipes sp.]